ncbi:MAG: HAMP domain-containing histidine kinase, partial [Alcaligenaceae bacterium]
MFSFVCPDLGMQRRNLMAVESNFWSVLACYAGVGLILLCMFFLVRVATYQAAVRRVLAALEKEQTGDLMRMTPQDAPLAVIQLAQAIDALRRGHQDIMSRQVETQASYAHDLRTPLTRMLLRCEMLDCRDLQKAMLKDLEEMRELVDASVVSARQKRSSTPSPRCIDADGLLDSLVRDYRDTGRSIELDGCIGQPVVACPQALRRVLTNLIDNALRYGSEVRVCARIDAEQMVVAVQDSGPGIVPTEMDAVFAPWYRS